MAQEHPSSSGEPITIQRVRPQQEGRLEMVSAAIGDDGAIGDIYSGYHDDLSPPLQWTGIPDAETFVLVVEDPDAPTEKPVLHWAAWNIPGTLEALPQGIRPSPTLDEFGGMVQGRNHRGQFGYMGPKPPSGVHRYHFQLFALDIRLDLPPSTPLVELVEVLQANTIAAYDLVGTYAAPGEQPAHSKRSFSGGEAAADRGGLDEDDVDRHAPHDPDGTVRP